MICRKTPEEIKKEDEKYEEEYRLQQTYTRMVKGEPESKKQVCEYYVVSKTKGKIDVWDLSILDIVGYIIGHKQDNGFEITKYCKPEQIIIQDWKTLQTIMALEAQYGHIVRDILGSMDKKGLYSTAQSIAAYKKEIEGEKISTTKVIDNLVKNELLKEQQQNKNA